VSSSWYYQYVKGIRPDLMIIDKELLRRHWYLRHIKINHPAFYEKIKFEFNAYETELIKFENFTNRYLKPQNDFDRKELEKIQLAFFNFLNAIVDKNNDINFYTTYEIEDVNAPMEKFGREYNRVPEGLLLRYTKTKDFDSTYKDPEFNIDITNNSLYYYEFMMKYYYRCLYMRINYLMNFGKFDEAEKLTLLAIKLENESPANIPSKEGTKILDKIKQLKELNKKN